MVDRPLQCCQIGVLSCFFFHVWKQEKVTRCKVHARYMHWVHAILSQKLLIRYSCVSKWIGRGDENPIEQILNREKEIQLQIRRRKINRSKSNPHYKYFVQVTTELPTYLQNTSKRMNIKFAKLSSKIIQYSLAVNQVSFDGLWVQDLELLQHFC